MPKYNNRSILRRIDLHDIKSLRRIMAALTYALDVNNSPLDSQQGEDLNLSEQERAWTNNIVAGINNNGDEFLLLSKAIDRFAKARLAPDSNVIQVTKELASLAEEDVLMTPTRYPSEYAAALIRFDALPILADPSQDTYLGHGLSPEIIRRSSRRPPISKTTQAAEHEQDIQGDSISEIEDSEEDIYCAENSRRTKRITWEN